MFNNNDNQKFLSRLTKFTVLIFILCGIFLVKILLSDTISFGGLFFGIIFGAIVMALLADQYIYCTKKYGQHDSDTEETCNEPILNERTDSEENNFDSHQDTEDSFHTSETEANISDLMYEYQGYLEAQMFDEGLATISKIIELFPQSAESYALRANLRYMMLYKKQAYDNRQFWDDLIADLKYAEKLDPTNNKIQNCIRNMIEGFQYFNGHENDFIAQHNILYEHFPRQALGYYMTICTAKNSKIHNEDKIKGISAVINQFGPSAPFLYAMRSSYYIDMDCQKYSKEIQNDINEALKHAQRNLFYNTIKPYFILVLISKLPKDAYINLDEFDNLNRECIRESITDIDQLSDNDNPEIVAIKRGYEIVINTLAKQYSLATIQHMGIFLRLLEDIKAANLDLDTYISNFNNMNLNQDATSEAARNIEIVKKCSQFANFAYELDNNSPVSCLALGMIKLIFGKQQEALELLNKSHNFDKNNMQTLIIRGVLHMIIEQQDKAREDFKTVLNNSHNQYEINRAKELLDRIENNIKLQSEHARLVSNTNKIARELDI